ncbi:hypothetical protein OSB04_030919 [Centaurea solstitialis]|uniref:PGG domain-containing protein n=1 Tax=Centaurea solstitialis TaxID=347529 RepID=A0AA38SLN7_9ASTR|nr:hypothetical protein OSB04_030919 [Centaurea solstitialis]
MERMEGLLFDASREGNVTLLQTLLQEDPLILDRVSVNHCDDMPLHVASMLGHVDFVNEILSRNPRLATESDSQRRLPLHIASAKGHVEIVKALLSAHPETCLARDRDGRNPLHVAAIKGRYEVVKELLQAQPHAARAMVEQETILHLCVKLNQLEFLKLLVERMGDYEFVNSKDADGNTILHLAVLDKQVETINFLLLNTTVEVNASNTNGDTPMNILGQRPNDEKDQQIIESLKRAGALEVKPQDLSAKIPQNRRTKWSLKCYTKPTSPSVLKKKKDWLEETRAAVMVVASLIATMAFQAGTNPPGGVWQEDDQTNDPPRYAAGRAIMASGDPKLHHVFLVSNSVGFVSTLSIILLLISGLPLTKKNRVFTWIMMIIMWIAATSMSLTYIVSVLFLTPDPKPKTIENLVSWIMGVWIILITLLVIGHIINGVVQVIIKLLKCFICIETTPTT